MWESACHAEDPDLIPGSGIPFGEENGNPFQYSCLGNSMDRGAWQATIHGITRVGHWLATKPLPPIGVTNAYTMNENKTARSVRGQLVHDGKLRTELEVMRSSFPGHHVWRSLLSRGRPGTMAEKHQGTRFL